MDYAKRNAVMWKYAPDLFDENYLETQSDGWKFDHLAILNAAEGRSLVTTPLFENPAMFRGMTPEEIAAELTRLMESSEQPLSTVQTLSLPEFFDGNTQGDSIAPNLGPKHPGIGFVRRTLETILAQPGVVDVRIGVHEWPYPDEDMWIVAENVYVWATGVEQEQMEAWVAPLRVDGVGMTPEGEVGIAAPLGGPALAPGLRLLIACWD